VTMHRTMLRPMIVSSCWPRAWLAAGYLPSAAERYLGGLKCECASDGHSSSWGYFGPNRFISPGSSLGSIS